MNAHGIRLQCQKVFLDNRQCPRPTFGDGTLCRWHRIGSEFHADIVRRGGSGPALPHLMMLGCATGFALPGVLTWSYLQSPSSLWLLLALWSGGWQVMLFSDTVLAFDYPLSHLAVWPQLLAAGTATAILGGLAASVWILAAPDSASAAIASILEGRAKPYYPAVAAVVGFLSTAGLTELLLRRLLYIDLGRSRMVLWGGAMLLAGTAVRPVLQTYGVAPTPEQVETFWNSVLGSRFIPALLITWFVCFNLCEVINLAIRRRECDQAVFQATIWPSFPICALLPVAAMLVGRLLLGALEMSGALLFGLVAVGLCLPACASLTRWLVRHASAAAAPR